MRNYEQYDTSFFDNLLSQFTNISHSQEQDSYDGIEQTDNTDNSDNDIDYQSQVSDLQNRNDELQRQLDNYDFQFQNKSNDSSFMNFLFSDQDNTPNDFTHEANSYRAEKPIVQNSNIDWIKKKDNSVNLSDLNGGIGSYLNSLPQDYKTKLLATSGDDFAGHVKGSKHYLGNAIDLRYDKGLYDYISNDPNLQALGLKTLPPNHGTAPHIHIQTK